MKLKTPLAFTIALINAGMVLPALAADDTDTKTTQQSAKKAIQKEEPWALDEIVVTATKRETNLMQTPIAITVVSQETLDREGISNAKDIAKLVPNMDVTFDSSQSAPVISMRGVRSTNITELGDPAVGLHLDGIYSPRPQGAMALMFDVERVEAQRGPQGTLFGRNSTVGNINIISKRPNMDAFDFNIGTELGRWNERQLHGMVNIPITDTFAIRASFLREKRDSYLDGYYDPNQWDTRYLPDNVKNAPLYTGPESEKNLVQRKRWWGGGHDGVQQTVKADPSTFYNNADQYAFRIAGLWQPTDDLSWNLSYEKFQDSSAGSVDTIDCKKANMRVAMQDNAVAPLQGCENAYGKGATEYTSLVSVPGMLDLSIENIRSNLRWDFSDSMAFVYNAGFAKQVRSQMSDQDRGVTDWDMSIFFRDATFKSQSHEFQIQSTGKTKLQWIAGVFAFEENNDMEGGWMNSMASASFWSQPDRTLASAAAFAQGTYDFTDALHLTLGYRHTKDTKEDVGGHNKDCNDSHPNLVDPTANGGKCYPAWDRDNFNKLPRDYFWNPDIYTVASNNDIKGDWSYNNYRLGIDYDVDEHNMVFGYVANGTKSGGIGDVFVQYKQDPLTTQYPTDSNGNRIVEKRWENTYNPEEVITWETGVKSDLFDKTLRLTASLFYSDYKDMQVAAAKPLFVTYSFKRDPQTGQPTTEVEGNPTNIFQTDNIGKASIKGLEVEFDWAATANDRISGHATWLKTEIVSDFYQQWSYATTDLFEIDYGASVDPNNKNLTVNLKGNELASSPKFAFNVNYSHNFHLGGSTLMPWISYNWRADSYFSIFNVDKHEDLFKSKTPEAFSDTRPALGTVNLGIKFTAPSDRWNVEAFVNNATNKVDFYWGGSGDGLIKGPVSMPRFYGVRANYNF